jgi:hypothetical protein
MVKNMISTIKRFADRAKTIYQLDNQSNKRQYSFDSKCIGAARENLNIYE